MIFNFQLLVSIAKLLESSSSGYLSFAHDFQFCAFGFQAVSSKRVLDHDLQTIFKKKTKDGELVMVGMIMMTNMTTATILIIFSKRVLDHA